MKYIFITLVTCLMIVGTSSAAILSFQPPFKNVTVSNMPTPVGTNFLMGQVLGANYLNQ